MECSNVHLISYLSEEEINDILIEKQSQLKHAVYIYHDMDDNEPHFHIVLKLLRSRDIDVIRRWFIIDERNTLARKNTYSNASVIEYFKHTNKASQEDGKHEYSLGDIKFFNCNIDSFLTRADNSFTILEEYLNGGIKVLLLFLKYHFIRVRIEKPIPLFPFRSFFLVFSASKISVDSANIPIVK